MSYSVNATAASKAAVLASICEKLDAVQQSQPIHAADMEQAKAATGASLDVLPEPNSGEEVYVAVSGSPGWQGTVDEHRLTPVDLHIGAVLRKSSDPVES